MKKQFLAGFFFTALYALIRYAGFGPVALIHVPVYILNKAICMTAVESLLMASIGFMRSERDAVRFWTAACTQLVFVHVFLSLGILPKGYYVHFFDGDKMSLTGEVVLLTGVLAVYCFWRLQAAALKPAVRRTVTILACLLVAGHLFAMGYNDTLRVEKWNGGLPPMSMLSFFLVLSSMVVFLLARERDLPVPSGEERVLQTEMDPL
jgi:hypothetical protein